MTDPSTALVRAHESAPQRLPGGALSVVGTWDGKVAPQSARVYRYWARTSEWVRGAVNIRKSQVSSAEWDIVPYNQRARWSKRQRDQVLELLRTPNPANDSWRSFIEPIIEDLLVLDAGCAEKDRDLGGRLLRLWPVDGATIKVDALWDGTPEAPRYFWYPDYKERARWRNGDFIYMMANPRTDWPIGLPPLETLRNAVEAEIAAHEYNRRQVENAAPDGIINLGENFTEPQVDRFREFFESEVAGRGPLGFIGGSKDPSFIKFRDSNRDQQFLEWQVYLVRKIAVVFGLTPQDLGVTFDINRSTSEIQLQVSEDRGLRPLMSLIQEYLTEQVVWDSSFGGTANNLAFRFTALNLKESTAKAGLLEKALAGVPWRFINEARIEEGREPIPGMENKLIMATSQGALDISDVPTVREYLEMQQAAKAPPPATGKSVEELLAELAPVIAAQVREAQRETTPDAKAYDVNEIASQVMSLVAGHLDSDRSIAQAQIEAVRDLVGKVAERPVEVTTPVTISPGAVAVSVQTPDVLVATPDISVAPAEVHVEVPITTLASEAPVPVRRLIKRKEFVKVDGQVSAVREIETDEHDPDYRVVRLKTFIRDDAGNITGAEERIEE